MSRTRLAAAASQCSLSVDGRRRPRARLCCRKLCCTSTGGAMLGKRATVISLITIGLGLGVVAVASADGGSGATSLLIASGESEGSFNVPQPAEHDVVIVQNT